LLRGLDLSLDRREKLKTILSSGEHLLEDTGKGISPADLPSIFKPFYQATNNHRTSQGVGLGLHISKQIVELLGGEISVVSELGQGSTFTFEIPLRAATPVRVEAVASGNGL
jgi:signal transduction histidine kinase